LKKCGFRFFLLERAAAIENFTKLGASTFVSSCARPPRNRRDGVAALAPLDAATQRGTASMLFAEAA
jgi:hypothetical protein